MLYRTGSSRDLEKPIDFWLRKGKAVGETEPTEKERTLQREQLNESDIARPRGLKTRQKDL